MVFCFLNLMLCCALLALFCCSACNVVLHLSLGTAQCIDRAVATSISRLTAKAADVMILTLMTSVCVLDCAAQ